MKIQAQIIDNGNDLALEATLERLRGIVDCRVLTPGASRSEARNRALADSTHDWHLIVEPGETLVSGDPNLYANSMPKAYRCLVARDDIITKEVRLFHRGTGLKFANPIHETLKPDPVADTADIVICVEHESPGPSLEEIKAWQQRANPGDASPYYYEAYWHLSKGDFDAFLRSANHYLFRCKTYSVSTVMTRYYMGVIYCHAKRDSKLALDNLAVPLFQRPVMAEGWCLLGDVFYHLLHDYKKARRFYELATLMGRNRKTSDEWPIQLSKYDEYPNRMMAGCDHALSSRQVLQIG